MARWDHRLTRAALAAAVVLAIATPAAAQGGSHRKLDRILGERASRPGTSRVIARLAHGADLSREVSRLGGRPGRRLRLIGAQALVIPNARLRQLAADPKVLSLHHDRPAAGALNRAAVTVGARAVQYELGYNGSGVGVAVIDSGITSWHDDLTYSGNSPQVLTTNGQRVAAFVDFVNGRSAAYDDHGHGTHVAGIIAGNGRDSYGARAGVAPAAHLVGLKVLDEHGRGVISDVIAALEWAVANRAAYRIRVVNLSVGAAVTESYRTDPLTLAARRAVDAGLVVVAAAGNLGRNRDGETQYGAITAPGNAPWVLTVGASSHQGTIWRYDDVMAGYSSRGPTAIDFAAKPDVVAPGTGIVSLADPLSTLYATKADYLLSGSLAEAYKPYLSLTGTSMAAPMVSGTVALMLQANPGLTPNMVKAVLQYTAQRYGYDALTQGAGFLNTRGAVRLARFFRTAREGDSFAMPQGWSKQVLWGNQRITGGVIRPNANAFQLGTVWGARADADGDNIVWGTLFAGDRDNIVWGTFDALAPDNIVWGTLVDAAGDNIVWGTVADKDNIVWGTFGDVDNIVWGTLGQAENIVWGTDCGGADCENIVWGTASAGDNIVWGTASAGDNIVWGTASAGDNIVWGTSGAVDNIVWGTSAGDDHQTWGSSGQDATLFDVPGAEPANYDESVWEQIFMSGPQRSTAGGGGL